MKVELYVVSLGYQECRYVSLDNSIIEVQQLKTDDSSSDDSGENDATNASGGANDRPTSCFCI